MPPDQFQQRLLAWFERHGRRDLPWQQDITPYRVWVSEIMLQQTQVTSAIGYFRRFVARFPNVHRLAGAELDEVLQHWAGLGYYARARNLHKTAQIVAASGGEFPRTLEDMSALPGIGRSTAGAILSIACGQRQAILDGNVKRVLARFHAVEGWPGATKVAARLWQIAEDYTPAERSGAYTQAMMDLGATLCTRAKPQCAVCPVGDGCQARQLGLAAQLPHPKPRKTMPIRYNYLLVLRDAGGGLLLQKRPPAGIWGGLWSLPEFAGPAEAENWCAAHGYRIGDLQALAQRRHTFSHYHLDYIPLLAALQGETGVAEPGDCEWHDAQARTSLGIPTPVRQLLADLADEP